MHFEYRHQHNTTTQKAHAGLEIVKEDTIHPYELDRHWTCFFVLNTIRH
jgi:hypothetical protein